MRKKDKKLTPDKNESNLKDLLVLAIIQININCVWNYLSWDVIPRLSVLPRLGVELKLPTPAF